VNIHPTYTIAIYSSHIVSSSPTSRLDLTRFAGEEY